MSITSSPFADEQLAIMAAISGFSGKSRECRNKQDGVLHFDPFMMAAKLAFDAARETGSTAAVALPTPSVQKPLRDFIKNWIGNVELLPQGSEYRCWGIASPFRRMMNHVYDAFQDEVRETIEPLLRINNDFDSLCCSENESFRVIKSRVAELDQLADDISEKLKDGYFGWPQLPNSAWQRAMEKQQDCTGDFGCLLFGWAILGALALLGYIVNFVVKQIFGIDLGLW